MENPIKLSFTIVAYNEEKIIRRCLEGVKDIADEIIFVHDGVCTDKTVDIAKEFTDKIFIRKHTGDSSLHRVFTYNQAQGEWIFQIDADEYIDKEDQPQILKLIQDADSLGINAYRFQWEMWNGKKAFCVKGFQKDCLFRKNHFHYLSITHGYAYVDGKTSSSGLTLHHRPSYNNIGWKAIFRKIRRWVPIHINYFFYENIKFEAFNIVPDKWIDHAKAVRARPFFYLFWEPVKMSLGQLKNGLYTHPVGWKMALNQYLYYFALYYGVWQRQRKLKSR